jgi:hypothetical protein
VGYVRRSEKGNGASQADASGRSAEQEDVLVRWHGTRVNQLEPKTGLQIVSAFERPVV